MAQLRQLRDLFTEQDIEVIIVGPEQAKQFAEYFEQHRIPFTGLPDPKHSVLKQYGQEVSLFKLGRMPAQVLVDRQGTARFVHYGNSMADIPSAEEIIALAEELNAEPAMLSHFRPPQAG